MVNYPVFYQILFVIIFYLKLVYEIFYLVRIALIKNNKISCNLQIILKYLKNYWNHAITFKEQCSVMKVLLEVKHER